MVTIPIIIHPLLEVPNDHWELIFVVSKQQKKKIEGQNSTEDSSDQQMESVNRDILFSQNEIPYLLRFFFPRKSNEKIFPFI